METTHQPESILTETTSTKPAAGARPKAGGIAKFQSLFRRKQDPTFNTINPCYIIATKNSSVESGKDAEMTEDGSESNPEKSIPHVGTEALVDTLEAPTSFPPIYITNIGGATAVFRSTPPFVNSLSPIQDFLKQRNVRVIVSALSMTNEDDMLKGTAAPQPSAVSSTATTGKGSDVGNVSSIGGRATSISGAFGAGTASGSSHLSASSRGLQKRIDHSASTPAMQTHQQQPFQPPPPLTTAPTVVVDANTINYGYNGSNAEEYERSIQLGYGCVGGGSTGGGGATTGGSSSGKFSNAAYGYGGGGNFIPGGGMLGGNQLYFGGGGASIPGGGLFNALSNTPSRSSSFIHGAQPTATPPRIGSGNTVTTSPPLPPVGSPASRVTSPVFAPAGDILSTPPSKSPLMTPNANVASQNTQITNGGSAPTLNIAASVYTPTYQSKSNSFRVPPSTNFQPAAATTIPPPAFGSAQPSQRSVTFSSSQPQSTKPTYVPSKEPLAEIPTAPEVIATWVSYCSSLRVFLPSCPDYITEEPTATSFSDTKMGVIEGNNVRVHLRPYPVYLRIAIPPPQSSKGEEESADKVVQLADLSTNVAPSSDIPPSTAAFPALGELASNPKLGRKDNNKWKAPLEVQKTAITGTPLIYPLTEDGEAPEITMGQIGKGGHVSTFGMGEGNTSSPPLRADTASYSDPTTDICSAAVNQIPLQTTLDSSESPVSAPQVSSVLDRNEKAELGFLLSVVRHHEKHLAKALDELLAKAEEGNDSKPKVNNAWATKANPKSPVTAANDVSSADVKQLSTIHVPFYYIHIPVEDNHNTRLLSFLHKVTTLMSAFSVPEPLSQNEEVQEASQHNKGKSDSQATSTTAPAPSTSWASRLGTTSDSTKRPPAPENTTTKRPTIAVPDVDDDDFDAYFSSQVTSPNHQSHHYHPFPSSAHLSINASTRKLQKKLFANQIILQQLLRATDEDKKTKSIDVQTSSLSATLQIPNQSLRAFAAARRAMIEQKSSAASLTNNSNNSDAIYGLPSSIIVHCLQGISRSASIVIGYLMQYGHRDFGNSCASDDFYANPQTTSTESKRDDQNHGGTIGHQPKKKGAVSCQLPTERAAKSPLESAWSKKPSTCLNTPLQTNSVAPMNSDIQLPTQENPWFKNKNASKATQEATSCHDISRISCASESNASPVPTGTKRLSCPPIRLMISVRSTAAPHESRSISPDNLALVPVSYLTALTSVEAARPVINPNPLFRAQLVKFELPRKKEM